MTKRLSFALMIALFALVGCVTQEEYDQAMADSARRLYELQQRCGADVAALSTKVAELQAETQRLAAVVEERDKKITDGSVELADLRTKLDDAMALQEQLTRELERAGKGVDQLVAERGSLKQALDDTKARLEELRKAQAAAAKRAELFKKLLLKFKKMIDAGSLSIVLRDGRMVLQLRNDVLFDSGRVDIKKEGKDALAEVARILATLEDRELQVAGHTDNVPIASARFPSNWELSAARALAVVHHLIDRGVKPKLLSAAGYGEHDPVASNDKPEGRARNRRIEIVLMPDITELVQLPEEG
jgi:chemotaxis protein MotB